MGKNLKKLTILHSNDLHGDFMAKEVDSELLGGVSRLSGYVQKVRKEEPNVLYAVSGDMFRGSVIDSEYKGISTIEIMNMLGPDVVTLGNHEVDYGIAHLLFIEKCAQFPIINANVYLTTNQVRLFRSHIILEVDGIRVLFIGILTEEVLASTRQDKLIGSFVDVHEAAQEVGKICNAYQTEDIDFTVVLTHIGFEADKKLAAALDPRWGVDLIIGGHSHTLLEQPELVEGIPIVQAAYGTAQIGRFDIMVDTDRNCIDSYSWRLIPIEEGICPRDEALEEVIGRYKELTDRKYNRLVTRFAECYTHPDRYRETSLGNLIADAFRDGLGVDVMLLGSGSIRGEALGPIVQYRDLLQVFPYNDEIYRVDMTGAQLRRAFLHFLRDDVLIGTGEYYQVSHGLYVEYDRQSKQITRFTYRGNEIRDEDQLTVGLQLFHLSNLQSHLGLTLEEVSRLRAPKVLSTNSADILEEHFSQQELVRGSQEQRLVVRNR